MQITSLSIEKINFVVDNLSMECSEEATIFGLTANDLKEKFISMIGQPFSGAFHNDNGICCVLFGLQSIGEYRWRTNFLSIKNGLKEIIKPITRFFIDFSNNLIKEGDGKGYIEILSAFNKGKTCEWFRLMGFQYIGTGGKFNKFIKNGR